jgi:hypothetical protein
MNNYHVILEVSFFLASGFALAFGMLMVFWPRKFLKLCNALNPGHHVLQTEAWRSYVHGSEFRLIGRGLTVVGAFAILLMLRTLL